MTRILVGRLGLGGNWGKGMDIKLFYLNDCIRLNC